MFGTERMLAALNEDPDGSPEQILVSVRHAVDGFVQDAEQFDDLTMLCLEYKGKNPERI
jgi:sigma-B regulation protein RsbU (phosphoserine phosphatase)